MKRVLLTIAGTVVGIVALLSYKTHGAVTTAAVRPAVGGAYRASTSTSAASLERPRPRPPARRPTRRRPRAARPRPAPPARPAYTGSAVTTRYGIVQVKITVSGKKITNVSFAQLTAFDGRSQQINSDAAPILLQETLSAQSANIDSVSGASYTSEGYVQSLQSALDQAGL